VRAARFFLLLTDRMSVAVSVPKSLRAFLTYKLASIVLNKNKLILGEKEEGFDLQLHRPGIL
jgi:hypothetical protein